MTLRKWDDLPAIMKNESVRYYYNLLYKKRFSILCKRIFDILTAIITFIILSPAFIIISIAIKIDSRGPVIFKQVRVTQYGKKFKIYKFRTMIENAEEKGTKVTTKNDRRITKVGKVLRKYRLDEFPQLFNIFAGDMSFVGTRPEVVKYVEKYTDEMWATLLLPAGITSEASIRYKDEERLLSNSENVDHTYINKVLPEKMKYNLKSIENFSFFRELKTMTSTVLAVIRKDTEDSSIVY
jgi:lipopolysaccharide/colanic/teichoic acid biosynthesis glycosyltransferase